MDSESRCKQVNSSTEEVKNHLVKIIGVIHKMTMREVTIRKLNYEEFMRTEAPYDLYRTLEENISLFYGSEISLKYLDTIVDDLVKYVGHKFCEIEVDKGIVFSIKPFKTEGEILQEYEKEQEHLLQEQSPRDKLRVILNVLVKIQNETGMVMRSDLTDKLATEFGIDKIESERMLGLLVRDGTIYEPKKGYLKKT